MRFREFKPTLLEFAPPTGKGSNDLQLLANIVDIVPSTDPLYSVAMGIIKSLVTDVIDAGQQTAPAQPAQAPQPTQLPQQAQPVQQQPQVAQPQQLQQQPAVTPGVTEDVEPGDENWYEKFIAGIKDPKISQRMLNKLRTDPEYREEMRYVHKNQDKKIKAAFTQGGDEALVTVDEFFKQVKRSADLLAGKAVGVLSELKNWYDLEARRNPDDDSKENARPQPTKNALYQKLLYPLENIFQDLGFKDTPPNLKAFKQEAPKILAFMNACEDGIIEFRDLLEAGGGNVRDLITDPQQAEIYNKIFDKLLALDAGQGGGAWGPAELGLATLCKPVAKAKGKGDLVSEYNGEVVAVEVKASREAAKGGRLGGKGVLTGSAGRKKFIDALNDICGKADFPTKDLGKTFNEVAKYKMINGVKTRVASDKVKEGKGIKITSMSSPKWFENFNREIPHRLTEKRIMAKEAVGDFLVAAISSVVSTLGEKFISEKLIRSIPNEDGTIDYEKFKRILTRQWYEIYKRVDDIGLILVINPTNGNYTLVNSGAMLTAKKSNVVISGGIDFDDSQGKAGPQIGIA